MFIDMDFLADLASLGSKLMKKNKKRSSPYVKWFLRGRSRGGVGRVNYHVNYLCRLIFLYFGNFLMNNSWVPPPTP